MAECRIGAVYMAQNPKFPDLFKIGLIEVGAKKDWHGLTFLVVITIGHTKTKAAKNYLQDKFEKYRHCTKAGRKTEFFSIKCFKKAEKELRSFVSKSNLEDLLNALNARKISK